MLRKASEFLGIIQPKQTQPVVVVATAPQDQTPKEIYLSWKAASRLHQDQLNTKLIKTLSVVGVVISLLLVLMGEFFLILVIGSAIFMVHILSKTVPEQVSHEISNHGVINSDHFYAWHELKEFFFTKVTGSELLAINTVESLPGRLFFIFEPARKEEIKALLEKHITFLEEEPLSALDKAYYQIINKFNF